VNFVNTFRLIFCAKQGNRGIMINAQHRNFITTNIAELGMARGGVGEGSRHLDHLGGRNSGEWSNSMTTSRRVTEGWEMIMKMGEEEMVV
jgi:hypothetical protein